MSRFVMPLQSAFGQRVVPFDGAKMFFFDTGTSNAKDTFSDEALTTANPNPVIADSNGLFPAIFLGGGQYKVQLKDKNDVQAGFGEEDPVTSTLSAFDGVVTKDTVAAMKSDTSLQIGALVRTRGYTSIGDGGGALYRTAAAQAVDGIGNHLNSNGNALLLENGDNVVLSIAGATLDARQFGIKPDGATDNNLAITAILAAKPGGGEIFFPEGAILTSVEHPLHSGLIVRGSSNVDPFYGTKTGNETATMFVQTTESKAVFKIGIGVCDLSLENFSLSSVVSPVAFTAPSTTKIGIRCEGDRPFSTFRISFKRLSFYNFLTAISVVGIDTGAGVDWQCDSVSVKHCSFWNNTTGAFFNTTNADAWGFETCVFTVATNGDAVLLERSGYMSFKDCYSNPSPVNPTGFVAGTDFIHIASFVDNITMINCQSESQVNFLHVDTSTGFENVFNQYTLDGCIVESPCTIERECKIVSRNSRYTQAFNVTGDDVEIHSFGDSFDGILGVGFNMTGARPQLYQSPGNVDSTTITSVDTATATTVFTVDDTEAIYSITSYLPDAGGQNRSTANVFYDGTNLALGSIIAGTAMVFSVTGQTVQVTQNTGTTQNVSTKVFRLA